VDARFFWLLWLVPVACSCLAYAALRRGWPAWLLLLAAAGYSLPLWLGVLALAYLRGERHPLALAPFLAALFAAMIVGPILNLKVSALEEKGLLRLPRFRMRYPFTLGMAVAFLGGPAFLWLAGERNERLLGALLALGLALLLVFLLFERSQKKSSAGD
jgi:hypothetical protein